jgi:DNA-binding GntR family transcriptional regulator
MATSPASGSGAARSGKRTVKRYHVVTETLRREIQSGRYPVDTDLPTESEICARFEVSRFTAREALRRLEEAGFIVRRQGAGNRVVSRDPAVRYLASIGSQDDVLRYARDTTLVTDGTWTSAVGAQVAELELDTGHDWVHLNGVRRAGVSGSAIGFTEVWVVADLRPYLPLIDPGRPDSIFSQLSAAADLMIQKIEQEIYSTALEDEAARSLGARPGSPALVVVRRYSATELGCFEVARTTHPADRFRYNLTLVNAATSPLASPAD